MWYEVILALGEMKGLDAGGTSRTTTGGHFAIISKDPVLPISLTSFGRQSLDVAMLLLALGYLYQWRLKNGTRSV